jgi:hypothetical protein
MAIATIEAKFANVELMAIGDRLGDRHADAGNDRGIDEGVGEGHEHNQREDYY